MVLKASFGLLLAGQTLVYTRMYQQSSSSKGGSIILLQRVGSLQVDNYVSLLAGGQPYQGSAISKQATLPCSRQYHTQQHVVISSLSLR